MSFRTAIQQTYDAVKSRSVLIKPGRWQSMDVSDKPEAATYEVLNHTLRAQVPPSLDQLRVEIAPNLPWADDHFLERVGGKPLNPGVEWAHWPWANSANSFRQVEKPTVYSTEPGFHHSYMERYWPKQAGAFASGHGTGIRYDYGDVSDVVEHLAKAPESRQAYLPIFFPEDTGKLDVRVPCTLGYHFIQRNGYFHCTYYIRSCDLYRHFRDDVYLTARLQLWMLDELRKLDDGWKFVEPGMLTMHIVSLHMFINDYHKTWGHR